MNYIWKFEFNKVPRTSLHGFYNSQGVFPMSDKILIYSCNLNLWNYSCSEILFALLKLFLKFHNLYQTYLHQTRFHRTTRLTIFHVEYPNQDFSNSRQYHYRILWTSSTQSLVFQQVSNTTIFIKIPQSFQILICSFCIIMLNNIEILSSSNPTLSGYLNQHCQHSNCSIIQWLCIINIQSLN